MTSAPDRALRVAVLSELPTPYRWPLFQRVAARAGLDLSIMFYARAEADRDWALDVSGSPDCAVSFLPGRVIHVRFRRSLFFHWNPGIGRRLRDGHFDVVVIPGWSMPTSLAAALACRRAGVPYVIFSETNDLSPRPAWLRALKRVVLRPIIGGAAAWLATGSMSARFLERHGARPERIHRFANTPDVEALTGAVDGQRAARAETRAALGIPEDVALAVFVGRLIGVKDVATLVAAQALVEAAGCGLWTLVVGDGVERDSLCARMRGLSIDHMVFAGARRPTDLPAIWAAADLFVLPSLHEPWGVVVNEAMCAGLPVILSDRVGAGPDLLVEGATGRGFPAGDADALSRAMIDLDVPAVRHEMGAAALRRAQEWGYGPSVAGFEAAVRDAVAGAR